MFNAKRKHVLTVFLSCMLVFTVIGNVNAALYEEKFPWTGTTTQDLELRAQGWCGGNAGDPFCNNPPGTPANQGGEGAISSGNGPDTQPGFAFWSQTGINADSFLYTNEFSFDNLSNTDFSFSWFRRDSGNEPARLAFLLGNDWYISDQTFAYTGANSSDWAQQNAKLSDLTFFQRSTGSDPSVLPGGGVDAGGPSLPTGTVDAFGFWWDGPKAATSRFDDVTVNVVPIPGAVWLLGSGLLGLVGLRKKLKK